VSPYNSTIRVKKKRCSGCGLQAFIFSHGLCEPCARVANYKKLEAKDNDAEEEESVAILKKDADLLFSRVVRLRAAAPGTGLLACYICDDIIHYSRAQLMHFEGRVDSVVRYHPKNGRPGCENCNIYLGGNLEEYAKRLDAEEKDLSEWLHAQGRQPYKFWRQELKTMIADYAREINQLKKLKQLK
jgi:hypothetical protein